MRVAESRRRGSVLWDGRRGADEDLDESVQGRPLLVASGQTQAFLHSGLYGGMFLYPPVPTRTINMTTDITLVPVKQVVVELNVYTV